MNKDESKRLEKLQGNGKRAAGRYLAEKLTYPDLLLLLQEDDSIRKLICKIVSSVPTSENDLLPALATEWNSKTTMELPAAPLAISPPQIATPKDPLRDELAAELNLLKAVIADHELAEAWLIDGETEGQQLMRLLSMVSDWNAVLDLWGRLAGRCKDDKRQATRSELHILKSILEFHNLRWRDRRATLNSSVKIGSEFHHEYMERGVSKGLVVKEVWLPGIVNAAGEYQKKPLVKT